MSATGVNLTIQLLIVALLCAGSYNAAAMEEVRYVHTDALGSPVAFSNDSGEIVARAGYEPYGAAFESSRSNKPGYGGHVGDGSTSLLYMQQRYYDPEIGGFLSVDPVTAYSGPQVAFARYRYANGNPYRFVDPDGRRSRPAKITGSNIPGNKSASAAMATGVPRPSAAAPAAASATPSPEIPQLLEHNVRVEGAGKDKRLYREWYLDGPSEVGGYVVQKISVEGSYTMPGGVVNPFSFSYWEAWEVPPGAAGTFPVSDLFSVTAHLAISGRVSWRGEARFHQGLRLPSSFVDGGTKEAGILLSTYENPRIDSRGTSNTVIVEFDTSW